MELLLGRLTLRALDKCGVRDMAVPVYIEDRPPKGLLGLVDWRLHGLLSLWIARGFLEPRSDTTLMYGGDPRLKIKRFFFRPMGSLADLRPADLARIDEDFAAILSSAGVAELACSVPGVGARRIRPAEAVEQWLAALELHLKRPKVDLFVPDPLFDQVRRIVDASGWRVTVAEHGGPGESHAASN